MKRGFIQPNKTTQELFTILKNFEEHGVPIQNITINSTFDEFLNSVNNGDVIIVDSYTEIFGGLNEMLTRLVEFFERGITIESYDELSICLESNNIAVFKTILLLGAKVKASRTIQGIAKARESGVKLGRPFGTTKANSKVQQVDLLHKTQGLSISKACKEVGCNPRTYYRHTREIR